MDILYLFGHDHSRREAGEEINLPQTGNTDPAAVYVTVLAVMLLTGGAVCCRRAFRRKETE